MKQEISASKLCKASLCGKWVSSPEGGRGGDGASRKTTEAILDGNLRHALMEFFIINYVKDRLRLSRSDFDEMMSENNIRSLFDFLEENKQHYPSDLRIKSRRMASKLAEVIDSLGTKLSQHFGDLISAEAELNIGGLDIELSDSFVLNRGEIDAVFVFTKADKKRVVVVDWKRTIDDTSKAFYEPQLYTYAHCLIQEPNLVHLPNIENKDFCLLLVEVGKDEERAKPPIPFRYSPKQLQLALDETSRNLESLDPQVGSHCSSRCPHAFHRDAPCLAFDSAGEYEPNLTREVFWNNRKYADDGHFSMVQVKVAKRVFLRRCTLNIVKFSANNMNKTIQLRNIEDEFMLEPDDELRIEGYMKRISKDEVDIYCKNILRIRH